MPWQARRTGVVFTQSWPWDRSAHFVHFAPKAVVSKESTGRCFTCRHRQSLTSLAKFLHVLLVMTSDLRSFHPSIAREMGLLSYQAGDLARRFQGITTGLASGMMPDKEAVKQLADEMYDVNGAYSGLWEEM